MRPFTAIGPYLGPREGPKAASGQVNPLLNRTSSYLARPHQASLRAR
jgi:hypothetical protein